MKLPLLATVATLALAFSSSVRAEEPFFRFLDDFGKPWEQQRNPYEERIETERHDFTQSTVTVGRGVFQIESGYSYFYKKDGEETESSHTLPETLLRYGLSEDIDLRIRGNYAWRFVN